MAAPGQPPRYALNKSPSSVSLLAPTPQSSRGPSPVGVQATFAQAPRSVLAAQRPPSDDRYMSEKEKAPSPVPRSLSDKFALSANPTDWGLNLTMDVREPDDVLHNPDPRRDRKCDGGGTLFTTRGLMNLGCLAIMGIGFFMLFAGYPFITWITKHPQLSFGGFNFGGINASGQIPDMIGSWGLIDVDTPREAHTKKDYKDGKDWQLIFSDEFNNDGRTFYPGDDPYWEAVDLHYWQTANLEWYDPSAITTKGGFLEITLTKQNVHGLEYQGGMMSTWNKFCFTGGMIEASVVLPGVNNVAGLWPAIWTMGNLGRAGYGASLEGMWPYTYDSCDVGTVANQTYKGLPIAATENGDSGQNGVLSFLPGQRLSRCTCPGESHPGPVHDDKTYVGRAAPEIDIFEAQVVADEGHVSQSGQWAPFNAEYHWFNDSGNLVIEDPSRTALNTYVGSVFQQATSGITNTTTEAYELSGAVPQVYGFQYLPGFDDAYITWSANGKVAWTLKQGGMAADGRVEIGPRPVPQEPMYIIANLGISPSFGDIDFDHLTFPTKMTVDWIRVYQDPDAINYGCDPEDFPTAEYIKTYEEAYTNPNLTTWRDDYHQPFPKNSFLGQC